MDDEVYKQRLTALNNLRIVIFFDILIILLGYIGTWNLKTLQLVNPSLWSFSPSLWIYIRYLILCRKEFLSSGVFFN